MADFPASEQPSFPHAVVGAASPLWAYFGAATATGVAYWWMTRWARPLNMEALMALAEPVATPALAAGMTLAEAPLELAEATVETAVAEAHAAADPVVLDTAPVAEVMLLPETLEAPAAEPAQNDVTPEPEPEVTVAEATDLPVAIAEPALEDVSAAAEAPVADDLPIVSAEAALEVEAPVELAALEAPVAAPEGEVVKPAKRSRKVLPSSDEA